MALCAHHCYYASSPPGRSRERSCEEQQGPLPAPSSLLLCKEHKGLYASAAFWKIPEVGEGVGRMKQERRETSTGFINA
jgi:hypothetical protein